MTEKAHPSINRTADPFKTAVGFALAGGAREGFVVPSGSPTELVTQDSALDETQMNAFAESHSSSSFDITIDPGEAFVYGSWVAKDTETTVTLAPSTNDQTIYVGWNKDGSDDVIIGLASAFESNTGDTDMKFPLYDVDTDGSGVTSVTDRRPFTNRRRIEELIESPNGTPPVTLLQDGESMDITCIVDPGETMRVYRWGAYTINGETAPSGLEVQLLDGSDTVQVSEQTVNSWSDDPEVPIAEHENTSDSTSVFKLRANNATGNNYTTDGVGAHFAFIVEQV